MNEFEKIVDSIVEEAFTNGFTTAYFRHKEHILNRLKVFGYIKDVEYYLNEVGVKYAMDGYSEGIRNRMNRMREMEELDIHIKKFTSRKQNITFWMAAISFVGTIILAIKEVLQCLI